MRFADTMGSMGRAAVSLGLLVGWLAGCAAPTQETDGPEPLGQAVLAATVAEAADLGCSTLSVKGLSEQIVAQSNCIAPGAFVALPPIDNLEMSEVVFPYLEQPANEALVMALTAHPEMTMSVNSMLRTVAQQYLLYRWYQEGKCGIGLAATPGNSNHETGLAIDISGYQSWRPALEAVGFEWFGAADPVHFDYAGPGAVNYLGTDVLAFQQLWNLNHPDDPIAEDGDYGAETEARLVQAPAEGFPRGASCDGDVPFAAEIVEIESPGSLAPDASAVVRITVENRGSEMWDDQTRLGTTEPRDRESALATSDWLSPDRPAAVVGSVAPGETFTFELSIVAPTKEGLVLEHFGLVQEGVAWFGDPDQGGPADDAIAVAIEVEGGAGPEARGGGAASEVGDPAADGACSCVAAGRPTRSPGLLVVAALLGACRRRRPAARPA